MSLKRILTMTIMLCRGKNKNIREERMSDGKQKYFSPQKTKESDRSGGKMHWRHKSIYRWRGGEKSQVNHR